MTDQPDPDALAALDAALDSLGSRRRPQDEDPALAALGRFTRMVDAHTARALSADQPWPTGTQAEGRPAVGPTGAAATTLPSTAATVAPMEARGAGRRPAVPDAPPPRPSGRHRARRRRRLLALPVLAVLTLVVVGPVSQAPGSPLYPLHHWIFDQGHPSSAADDTRVSLTSAKDALQRASSGHGPVRAANLREARDQLAHARTQLAGVTDDATRRELTSEIDELETLADQLDDDQGQPGPDGSQQATTTPPPSSPSTDDNNSQGPDDQPSPPTTGDGG